MEGEEYLIEWEELYLYQFEGELDALFTLNTPNLRFALEVKDSTLPANWKVGITYSEGDTFTIKEFRSESIEEAKALGKHYIRLYLKRLLYRIQ